MFDQKIAFKKTFKTAKNKLSLHFLNIFFVNFRELSNAQNFLRIFKWNL